LILPEEDQDWQERVMNQFVRELEQLAAAEAAESTAGGV
jgi:hypothetical protein